jgi:hypothetical protein
LIGAWVLFFTGKLSILADLVSPPPQIPPEEKLVKKTVSPTPTDVVKNGFDSSKDRIRVDLEIPGLSEDITIINPANIALVADVSGSMNREDGSGTKKIEGVKKALKNMVAWVTEQNSLRPEDKQIKLSLVIYTTAIEEDAKTVFNFNNKNFGSPNDSCGRYDLCDSLYGAINALYPNGSTPIGKGLQKVISNFEALKSSDSSSNNAVNVVILYTDGRHNNDIDPTHNSVLNYFRNNKIPIFTIGYGTNSTTDQIDGAPPQTVTKADLDNICGSDNVVSKEIAGKTVYYCLVRGGVASPHRNCTGFWNMTNDNPWPNCVTLRLNALAYETGGNYYYSPDAEKLNTDLLDILKSITLTKTSAIEISENFDANYSYVDNSLVVSGPRGALTLVPKADDFFTDEVEVDKYFMQKTENGFKIWISSGTVLKDEKLKVSFELKANIGDKDTCIDKQSYVKWGAIDLNTRAISDESKVGQEYLSTYCYNLKSVSQSNPPAPQQTQPNLLLQTGTRIIVLFIISIVLIVSIIYIVALLKEE